jgi:hypothetical protein
MEVQDSGNLNQKGFLALLVDLHQQGATGSLKLEQAPLQKAVYFRDGQILFAASNDPHDQLASILVEEGKLSSEQMQVAQARVSAGNPLAKVLTELGYISQRELADAARLKVEKILTDLYGWKEGSYQFVERSLPKGAIDLELNTPRLLFNSIRRIQEREWVLELLGTLDLVLAAGPELETFLSETKPDPSAGEVLRLVDGVKTAQQIGAVSALGEFEVCKILSAALMIGALQKGTGAPGASATSEPASPPEPPLSPPSDDRAPLPPSLAETTALNVEDVAGRPPEGPTGTVVDTTPPVPLDQLEKSAASSSRPAADFVFDETPLSSEAPQVMRVPPRPRKMRGGGSESSKKLLIAVLVLAVLGGGGWAAYKYLWPTDESGAAPSTSTTAPTTDGTPTSPSPTTPETPGGAPSTSKTEPGQGTPQPTPPPSATTSGTAVPPSPPTTKPPTPSSTSPPGTSPRPSGSTPSASGAPLARGHDQLEKGNYPQAAATFLGHLRKVGTDKFTIAVGVFCDTGNVSRVVRNSGGSEQLLLLAFNDKGRSCYRVFWGIFDSRTEAQRAVGSVPNGVRARDSAPVPIARLLR